MNPHLKMQIVTGLLMSLSMSLLLSGFFTALQMGLSEDWPKAWLGSFAIGWPLAFALAMLIAGPVRRIAMRLSGL